MPAFLGEVATCFLCIAGGVYSAWLLARLWLKRTSNAASHCNTTHHRAASRTRLSRVGNAGFEATMAVAFLVVATTLLFGTWRRNRERVPDDDREEATPSRQFEIPGMVTLPRYRAGQPIVDADCVFLTVTDDDVRALAEHEPGIESLVLTGTQVTDASIVHLRQMPRLMDLGLGRTRITDSGCEQLAEMTSLEVLVLRDTAITDESLSSLKRLPCLRRLDLRHTFVTDVGLKSLRDSQNLKLLLVAETQVSKQAVQELMLHLPGLKSDLTE